MRSQSVPLVLATLASSSLLAACGGSDDSPVPMQPAQITATNANAVASGMPTTLALVDFQEVMGFQNLAGEGAGTTVCPAGGTATAGFATDVAPLGEVSTGDQFAVSFSNCMLDGESALNGGITIDFNTIDGDWELDPVWEVDFDFNINNLTFSGGGVSGLFDGGWSQNATYDNGDSTFSLTGDFTSTLSGNGLSIVTSLSGLTLTCDYDATAEQATYTMDGTFSSFALNGSIALETLTPIVVNDSDFNPSSGVLRATGSGDSTLTLTILDATFVQLDVDADGDGTAETQINTTWSEIE